MLHWSFLTTVLPVAWVGAEVFEPPVQPFTTTVESSFTLGPRDAAGLIDLTVQDARAPAELEPTTSEFEPIEQFGHDGSWRWNVYGGWGTEFNDSETWLALGGFGVSHFIADGLSLDMEFNGISFRQAGPDAGAFNFNLLFRWHFVMERTWSIYVDGGAGLILATEEVPAMASNFNLAPQAGVGLTVEVAEDVRLLGGVRWHHVSNANTYEENPARDSFLLYAGLTFPF